MALAQTPYGVPVERPTEPSTTPLTVGVPPVTTSTAPRGAGGGASNSFIPSISVSERYDSNVVFLPTPIHDYVTTIMPSGQINYENDWVSSSTTAGLTSEIYARNPGLNYVGANASVYATLDNLIRRVDRRASLAIMNSFIYTPQMPAFAAPAAGNQVAPEFVRGIQAYRNNALSNSTSVQGRYDITPRIYASASYSYSIMRFLSDSNAEGAVPLFNTTTQSITAGPQYQWTSATRVGLSYQYQKISFGSSFQGGEESAQSGVTGATIHGSTFTWNSALTRSFSVSIAPGVSVVTGSREPILTALANVQWNVQPTVVTVAYTRGVFPAIFGGDVMVSDMVSVSGSYMLAGRWTCRGDANYSTNRSVGSAGANQGLRSGFSSDGYTIGIAATYQLGQTTSVGVSANHSKFVFETGDSESALTRNTVMLQLRKEWK